MGEDEWLVVAYCGLLWFIVPQAGGKKGAHTQQTVYMASLVQI